MAMQFLGKYDSLGVLGRGGMGQVHVARVIDDPVRTVVIKIIRPELADTPRAQQFFEREVKYTARLRHPFIVRLLETGIDPDAGPCIVMEFVPGITLDQLLHREKRLNVRRAARLIGCLCHALEAAHTSAVIHRDLKPSNVIVVAAGTPEEHLKVMDFGVAYLASKPYLTKEQFACTGDVITQGTPAYISPEQLRGDSIDGRADLYSAGVMLFEALTGQRPFPDRDVNKLVDAHLHRPPPAFAQLGITDVGSAVEDVVRHCLAKFPAERPASARVLCTELGNAVGADLWSETIPVEAIRDEAKVPLAEDVPPEQAVEPNTLVRRTEAWMPDRIAVIKLGGFLEDAGGKLLGSAPGLLQARFASSAKPPGLIERLLGRTANDDIDLDLHLANPNPSESRLIITAVFRVAGGGPPRNAVQWNRRCLHIFQEMKRYLMAGR